MDFEEKELIRKTFHLAEENNKILRKMRASMQWSRAFRIFYWVIVIGVSIGAFYYIQPYIDQLVEAYSGLTGILPR
jgi:hypothetical protein